MPCNTDDHSTCWCPCHCGCEEPSFKVNPSGLCPNCEEDNHEVPALGFEELIVELIELHKSIIAQYEQVLNKRSK